MKLIVQLAGQPERLLLGSNRLGYFPLLPIDVAEVSKIAGETDAFAYCDGPFPENSPEPKEKFPQEPFSSL